MLTAVVSVLITAYSADVVLVTEVEVVVFFLLVEEEVTAFDSVVSETAVSVGFSCFVGCDDSVMTGISS